MRTTVLLLLGLAVVSGCETPPKPATTPEPAKKTAPAPVAAGSVVIDRSEVAYTVFTRLPEEASAADIEKIQAWLAKHPDSEAVEWASFKEHAQDYVGPRILKNDYADCDVPRRLAQMLGRRSAAGAPLGVTWNGGVALTYNDYERAKALHAAWLADPKSETRPADRGDDRLHPDNHLRR
jgi:hypothetical protein